ncbi:hypothetical protein LSH36_112g01027 [Paralvinella palmiformis]|uniref:VTT domain-containing protein n=1 Tax=Paralvinella palmiformis TaxID=53620 RepID=A0AAD9JZ91_9ANNE|nr:hypothetical protein LSH36_112g01027 [Paralvinella palmiformis]
MYSYRPEYEPFFLVNTHRVDRRLWVASTDGGHWHSRRSSSVMDHLRRFVNENFFFRIDGVDSDDDLEKLVIDGGGGLHSADEKQKGEAENYAYSGTPTLAEECSGGVGQDLGKMQIVETNQEPTQLSCLSISVYSAVVIAMVCIFLFIGRDYVKFILFSLQEADFWISLLVFALLFTIVAFPMTWGYILLNIAAGYLYGLLLGLVIVISCALIGLFIAHCVIRRFLRNFVLAKFTNKSFVAIMNVVDHSSIGFKVVVWARLTPIPFGLQNALFAYAQQYCRSSDVTSIMDKQSIHSPNPILLLLNRTPRSLLTPIADITGFRPELLVCSISTPQFLLASALGMLPTQGMHAYIGSTLRSMEEVINNSSGSTMAYVIFGTQLVIAIGLLGFVIRRARIEFNKMVQNAQSSGGGGAASNASHKADIVSSTQGMDKVVTLTLAHSRSASVPGALLVPQQPGDRPRTGSFSPKSQT